jgi:putative endopeptidase
MRNLRSTSARSLLTLVALVAAPSLGACAADEPPPVAPVPVVAPPAASPPPASTAHGINVSALDRTVRPGADFYEYANGAWLKSAVIPDDRSSTGPFVRIVQEVEQRTKAILDECATSGAAKGTPQQRIGDTYASFMDEAGIEAKGLAPLKPVLDRIAKLSDKHALSGFLGGDLRADVDALNNTNFNTEHLLGLWVEQDLNDPSRVAPYLFQGGLGMPDRSYYLDPSPHMEALRTQYVAYITTLLKLAGVAHPEAKAKDVFDLERAIATVHASRVDSEDVKKADNPWAKKDFGTRAPGLDWTAFFKAAGLDTQPGFIVWHPTAVTGIAALVQKKPLAVWKEYLTFHALNHATPFLPKAFVDASFAFYGTAMRGTPKPRDRWKRAIDVTNQALEEAVGKIYVERHFRPEYRKDLQGMVDALVAAFGRRIDGLAWMSAGTKAKAKAKLATLKVGVAYPDVWRDDTGLDVVRGDALGNAERAELFKYKKALAKIGKPANRGEWVMAPQTVNAVNLPVRNALNFPAAIFEPPFYDPKATPAVKFAAIGAIIGHEISHSFDDQGALFDASGKLASWWTPEDFAHFEASGAALAKQYDSYHPFPDLAVNGKQTLSENIADLAGLAVAYDAWKAGLHGAPAPVVDGLTGDQQFFLSFAQSWQGKLREPALRQRIATDGHAPPQYRALTVRNLDAWYPAFDVASTDALYLAPDARVRVW